MLIQLQHVLNNMLTLDMATDCNDSLSNCFNHPVAKMKSKWCSYWSRPGRSRLVGLYQHHTIK